MSQDDGGDLLTWKISPVNQRLQSLSKHIDSIRPCSLNQATPPTVTLLNKLLCPPPREPPQTNLLPVNSVGFKGANPLQDTQQSPFRTIPSLSYANDKIFLGPLMFTSKCVLVGDHYQLPPLVQSTEAQENGMGISLFCRLSEAHPQAIAALQSQYQMCQGIMELSNALIDGDKLRCGSSEIANAKLHLSSLNSCSSWLKKVLDRSRPMTFIDTDAFPAFEVKDSKIVNNPMEAYIVGQVVKALINCGFEDEIGIITPYNSQANLIRTVISAISVVLHTIDNFQGRDKDCIIVSFVRSCENSSCNSSLLGDWHPINMALTRARPHKCVIQRTFLCKLL